MRELCCHRIKVGWPRRRQTVRDLFAFNAGQGGIDATRGRPVIGADLLVFKIGWRGWPVKKQADPVLYAVVNKD